MSTTLEYEIRAHLIDYLIGQVSLRDFETWFTAATWNAVGHVARSTEDLIGEVALRLAEWSSGHRTTEEIHDLLAPLATNVVTDLGRSEAVRTGADNAIIATPEVPQLVDTSRLLAGASA